MGGHQQSLSLSNFQTQLFKPFRPCFAKPYTLACPSHSWTHGSVSWQPAPTSMAQNRAMAASSSLYSLFFSSRSLRGKISVPGLSSSLNLCWGPCRPAQPAPASADRGCRCASWFVPLTLANASINLGGFLPSSWWFAWESHTSLWVHCVQKVTKASVFLGSRGQPTRSCIGPAEGDPLSVATMASSQIDGGVRGSA